MKNMLSQIQFHYQFQGDSKKPLILFLHGFLGNGNDWNEVIKIISRHYYCLTIDLPGHGKTTLKKNHDFSFEKTALALIEFLNQLEINKCHLIGYSMGGRIALFLALYYPQYFDKVVLESASPGLCTEREQKERIAQDEKIAQTLETGNYEAFLSKWYSQSLFSGLADNENFNQLLQRREESDPKALAQSLRLLGTGKQPSLWQEISRSKIPILLIIGGEDIKFQSIANDMKKLNQFMQIQVIEKCSHNVHSQKPKEFANRIFKFFNSKN